MSNLSGNMFIGSHAVRGDLGTIRGRDPRTGQELEPAYGLGGPTEVARAAELASQAAVPFRRSPAAVRSRLLDQIATNIELIGDDLIERAALETGIETSRLQGERKRTIDQLRMFADAVAHYRDARVRVDHGLDDRVPVPRPEIRQQHVAVGPVAIFGASNFPLAFSVSGGDTAAALAVGSPVVFKAHSSHPGTSELVGGAIQAAVRSCGLPEGVFSLLYGRGSQLGMELVKDHRIRAVSFTGSRAAGLALQKAANARPVPIPVYAEMSSLNPVVVLPGAVAERGEDIAAQYVTSYLTSVGQLCTSPGLLLAVEGETPENVTRLIETAAAHVARMPAAPMLSLDVAAEYNKGVSRLLGHEKVIELAHGVADSTIAVPGLPRLFSTTADVLLSDTSLHDEVFGPSSMIVRVRDQSQLVAVLAQLEGQLTATVHAADIDDVDVATIVPLLEDMAGRLIFDGWPTGVEVVDSMVHGGPFPATTISQATSVGSLSMERFLRPIAYQSIKPAHLPDALRDDLGDEVHRLIDGSWSTARR